MLITKKLKSISMFVWQMMTFTPFITNFLINSEHKTPNQIIYKILLIDTYHFLLTWNIFCLPCSVELTGEKWNCGGRTLKTINQIYENIIHIFLYEKLLALCSIDLQNKYFLWTVMIIIIGSSSSNWNGLCELYFRVLINYSPGLSYYLLWKRLEEVDFK